MTSGKVFSMAKRLFNAVIISFFINLIICTFLIAIIIRNSLKLDEFLAGRPLIERWYLFPESIAAIIGGLVICFLFLFIMRENNKLKQMKAVFEDLSKIDALTGIYNRRHLEDSLDQLLKCSSRSNSVLSLLMADVDFFKKYNDTYGHNMGDTCLKSIAEAIAHSVSREADFVARYGGEEFVVVLPFTSESGARVVAKRILENIRNMRIPHKSSDVEKYVTISIGGTTNIVSFTYSREDYIKYADQALYLSKQNGRNKYSFLRFP